MDFPRTYIDYDSKRFSSFKVAVAAGNEVVQSGTTIVAFVSPNRKAGIVASDGRVSLGHRPVQEDFRKVFDTRIGFIGGAGELGLLQILVPEFRQALTEVCDSRDLLMTATGASRRLYHYYRAVFQEALKYQPEIGMAFIALFWDEEEARCHLYELIGGSFLTPKSGSTIGSGASGIWKKVKDAVVPESAEELVDFAAQFLSEVPEVDTATNDRMFYGLIDDGEFDMGERRLTWQR